MHNTTTKGQAALRDREYDSNLELTQSLYILNHSNIYSTCLFINTNHCLSQYQAANKVSLVNMQMNKT